ncbi:hypothetical protein ACNZ7H_004901 [Escherichia coli]|nr:hypothetical protein [Escherichia coli]
MQGILTSLMTITFITVMVGCSGKTPEYMHKAVVGDINGRTIVMFPVGDGLKYRPQFTTDCPPALPGEDRPSTGGCVITPERVTNVEPYLVHKAHGAHANPRKPINADHTNYSNMINTTTDNL